MMFSHLQSYINDLIKVTYLSHKTFHQLYQAPPDNNVIVMKITIVLFLFIMGPWFLYVASQLLFCDKPRVK